MDFEIIENFRDLAEHPGRYGELTKGVIYRSGDLSRANKHDLALLKKLGIKTIIDLRNPNAWEERPCPFSGDSSIQLLKIDVGYGYFIPTEERSMPQMYLGYLANVSQCRQFFKAIVNCPKPILMHCEAGKDRTGVLAILLQMANGVSRMDIVDDYNLSYDGRLSRHEELIHGIYPDLPGFCYHVNPKMIEELLDGFYEKYGSVEDYLEIIGLDDSEIDAIRNIFGKQERSAGAVLFHENKVLVEHMQLGHYSMPKGHVEKTDKNLKETALREIREETGLKARILSGFALDTVYSVREGKIKRVTWYVGTVDSEETVPQEAEIQACYFLSPADAMRVLSYDSDRQVLKAACDFYFLD